MLLLHFLALIAISSLAFAIEGRGLRRPGPHVVKHGMFPDHHTKYSSTHVRRASFGRRQDPSPASCGSSNQITTKAPKTNIFAGLTDEEAAAVTSFLHDQESLNLTAAANATRQALLAFLVKTHI